MSDVLRIIGFVLLGAAVLGVLGALLIDRRLRRLAIPEGASFRETLRRVPFSLVLVLDLLDLGFDFFAAPVVWLWLRRYNLQALRQVAMVEALIPGTQILPTLSAAWFAIRVFDPSMRQPTIESQRDM